MAVLDGVLALGAGGQAKPVLAAYLAAGYDVQAIYDDNPALLGRKVLGIPVMGTLDALPRNIEASLVITIGDNGTRCRIAGYYSNASWPAVVHPDASVHPSVQIRPGVMVMAGAIIQPDAYLGELSLVGTGATVGHDCILGAFSHLAPGCHVAGGVTIGSQAFLGIGSSVLPNIKIGKRAVVGAGAVVTRDVPPGVVVVGVPARVVKSPTTSEQ